MIRTLHLLSIALFCSCLTVACGESDPSGPVGGGNNTSNGGGDACVDGDFDGFVRRTPTCPAGNDCNDADNLIKPGAAEVCGDQKDNDCDGFIDEDCARDCVDNDRDNYGQGTGCLGIDCNDANPAIHAGAREICGNTVDENCDGMAPACPSNCVDADQDGYGAAGSTDCPTAGVDCDDNNAAIHPEAREFCDTKDNNCDGTVDECPLEGQVCAGDACQGGAGAQCENHDDCAGTFLKCDRNANPRVCRQAENGPCTSNSDCLNGLACENNTCTGNWCAVNGATCVGDYAHCDRDAGQCVECPHWDPSYTVQDAACPDAGVLGGEEMCVGGGWCAETFALENDDPYPNTDTSTDIYSVSLALADCWINVREIGDKDMCYAFWVYNGVSRTITESMVEDAYRDGDMDNVLYPEHNEALKDAWGVGTFDRKEVDWKADLEPGFANDICLWYQPGQGIFSGEKMVVDRCSNFAP